MSTVPTPKPGVLLGPYKIVARIGAGGMGEVFRAIDTRLGRPVAIKISQETFGERFTREARAISALNHPHICTLYDVGPYYLVMELVEGETLADRLAKGRLSIPDTLKYGAQIADALAAAHAGRIVHRDLKPQNVMLGKSGIKVLDFGLAKSDQDTTLTASRAVVGTPAYMAPELFEGKTADARTDIYALGRVLYEMATGNRTASSQPLRMDALPSSVAHIISRCLAQDPEDRWQSARDLQKELEWLGKESIAPLVADRPTRPWIVFAAVIAIIGLAAMSWTLYHRVTVTTPAARAAEFTLSFTDQIFGAADNSLAIPSPDGRYVVFDGTNAKGSSLWLRAIDSGEAHPIPGTEGAISGFWSPDSQMIGFYANRTLKKISVTGGVAETIAALPGLMDPTWGRNGDILFRPTNRAPLWHVRDSGGPAAQLTELDPSQSENSHRGPRFLPDGRRFLFTTRCGKRDNNAVYIGSLDSPKNVRRLMTTQANVDYVDVGNGHEGLLLFYRDGGIFAQPLNLDQEQLGGSPFLVIRSVAYNPASIQAYYEASADGLIVFRPATAWGTRLSWFRRDGESAEVYASSTQLYEPRLSPRADRVAYAGVDPQSGNRDLFSIEIARGVVSRLTTHVANDWFPVWAPNGNRLLFGSDRGGGPEIQTFLKESIDPGSGESALQPGVFAPIDWSSDGKWIAFQSSAANPLLGFGDISIASFAGDRKPFEYLATPFLEGSARFSPNGSWVGYASDESGRFEVYARPFNGEPAANTGKVQLSNAGGDYPVWRADGRELYYIDRESNIFAVDTANLGKPGAAPLPVKLFRACPGSAASSPPMTGQFYGYAFDTKDGQRFLVNCMVELPGKFNVLMNWPLSPKQ